MNEDDQKSSKTFRENMDSLFKLTHVAPLHTATQALAFLFQIVQIEMEKKSENAKKLQTRFYRALYERMMSKELWNSQSRLKIVLNLMFRAMKHDPNPKRVRSVNNFSLIDYHSNSQEYHSKNLILNILTHTKTQVRAFTKRLLQTGMHGSSALSCGTLYLISAVSGKKNLFDAADQEGEYDPKKRDPIYCNADQSSVWELVMSQNHYHPSVRTFVVFFEQLTRTSHRTLIKTHTHTHRYARSAIKCMKTVVSNTMVIHWLIFR